MPLKISYLSCFTEMEHVYAAEGDRGEAGFPQSGAINFFDVVFWKILDHVNTGVSLFSSVNQWVPWWSGSTAIASL